MINLFDLFIQSKFVDIANKFANRNAFMINEVYYTYEKFYEKISKIRTLVKILNEDLVAIVANDDIETYASIFAIWMEGKAYVPLHPNQPIERNQEIIKQADIKTILDSNLVSVYMTTPVIKTNSIEQIKPTTEVINFDDDKLAYILFTSGSTGSPKGVQLTRKNIAAFIEAFFIVGFEINENDKCLQCFDLTFDVSIQSFLAPLTRGACVFTIPHNQIKYSYVYGLLEDYELTFGVFAPSMIRFLKPYFSEINLPKLKYCILTAEASPIDLINNWSRCIPNATIYNFYGPTEATIYCTYYQVPNELPYKNVNGLLCIGKPLPGISAIILDESKNVLPANMKGEMYVEGNQLTVGYWKNQEKNEESFLNINIGGKINRYYKTGDLCAFDDEGDILYFGRIDYQVKIQGYRIELGEIEHHARQIADGKNAVALVFDGKLGNAELALCIELDKIDEQTFIDGLKSKLPAYMIPSKLYNLPEFPLNVNGKIDRPKIKQLLNL
jgi:D-alanine--poly(phosphoribitol) ligase subunit 1